MSSRNRGRANPSQDSFGDEERKIWKEIKDKSKEVDDMVVGFRSEAPNVYRLRKTNIPSRPAPTKLATKSSPLKRNKLRTWPTTLQAAPPLTIALRSYTARMSNFAKKCSTSLRANPTTLTCSTRSRSCQACARPRKRLLLSSTLAHPVNALRVANSHARRRNLESLVCLARPSRLKRVRNLPPHRLHA